MGHNWKGGIIKNHQGYVLIWMPEHPRAYKVGYVRRSVLVVERKLGRSITTGEIVHHINRLRDDDRPENLMVLASQSKHLSEHNRRKESGRSSRKLESYFSPNTICKLRELLQQPMTERVRRRGRKGVAGRPADPLSLRQLSIKFNSSPRLIRRVRNELL